ncbi:MAG: hypothetical protein KKD44_23125 [Proteobacteria bacterium]|nr:hypothetical protein [Pseudomonadota bacterium]
MKIKRVNHKGAGHRNTFIQHSVKNHGTNSKDGCSGNTTPHILACTKYVELNPVRAGLVNRPEDWPWSSARPHITGKDDMLVDIKPLLEIVSKPWERFLYTDAQDLEIEMLRKHEKTGRPLGDVSFIEKLELILERILKPKKPGPKGKDK